MGFEIGQLEFEMLSLLLTDCNSRPGSFFFFSFIFISWRLITLQYYSGFCHTLT